MRTTRTDQTPPGFTPGPRPANRRNTPANRGPSLIGPNGERIRLADLPLVAYWLRCGCTGRQYAVAKGDLLFCDTHGATQRVTRTVD